MEYISSRQNSRIKEICALAERKYRYEQKRFIFEGLHLYEEYIKAGHRPEALFIREDFYLQNPGIIDGFDNITYVLSDEAYKKISLEASPQGLLCVSGFLKNVKTNVPPSDGGWVILDSVRDPGNVGGTVRTAASVGAGRLIMSSDCADLYNPKTVRASMGAVFCCDIIISEDIQKDINVIKDQGYRVFSSVPSDGEDIRQTEKKKGDCIIIGNEGSGIKKEIIKLCDGSLTIKMKGRTESLNAAAAAAIIIWEMSADG